MMTSIYERYFVKCPYVRAREYLQESLQNAVDQKDPQILPLAAPLTLVPGALEKNVLVRYERATDPMHFDDPWHVHWTPEGGGPYPDFNGQLTVRADESYRSAVLELRGEYLPPLGAVGRAFDLVAGSKIAARTARTLLARIASAMEDRYQTEEAAKRCSNT